MKKKIVLTSCLILCTQISYAGINKLDIMPDADGREYWQILNSSNLMIRTKEFDDILNFGKRNLEWLDHINKNRTEKLSFSTPENRRTSPINSPYVYNNDIIRNDFRELLDKLPAEIKEVLLGNQSFTNEPPVAIDDYLRHCLAVDYVYQGAARWLLLSPNILYLTENRKKDIRGFYNLEDLANRNEKLKNFKSLPQVEQSQIASWLIGICYNSEANEKKCQKKLKTSVVENNGNASLFYQSYVQHARDTYNENFIIPDAYRRNDIKWQISDQGQVAIVPFSNLNTNEAVKSFLNNIELEWKWNNWQLVLQYTSADNVPYIEFKPGETPHVNELGGNQIVMDANLPLTEWDGQWTIRHEFGHVLGFPDCYVEFYDESIQAIVNYQIDVTNLMCSRRGKLKETHFLEMKRQYNL